MTDKTRDGLPREALEHLAEALRLPMEPAGGHLSDEDFVAYVQEGASGPRQEKIVRHLSSCPVCAGALDAESREHTAFPEEAWQARRPAFEAGLRQQVAASGLLDPPAVLEPLRRQYETFLRAVNRGLAGLLAATGEAREARDELSSPWARARAAAADDGAVLLDEVSEDGRFGACVTETPSGGLSLSFESRESGLAGHVVQVYGGGARWRATLEECREGVACEIFITREEREQLPRAAELRASLAQVLEQDERFMTCPPSDK